MPILRLMIRLFPAAFRAQFGAEMEAQIRLDYARAAETGFRSQALFFAGTLVDLLASAVAERWHPSWKALENPGRVRRGMGEGVREWVRDLRHASRSLRRSSGFTLVSVATLGLAIGANAGIFSVVDTVLLNPLPFPEPEELVYIGATAPGTELDGEFGVSAEFLVEYNEGSQLLEGVAAYNAFTSSMRVGDRTERVWQSAPTVELFELLGVQPILGRLPEAADEDRVVLLSHALWVTWFGSDPGVIGESIFVTGAMRTVIGVMPSTFHFPDDNILLWFPNPIRPANIIPGRFGMQIVGRLAPGATHEGLQEELTTLARRLPERFGGSPAYARVIAQHRPVIRSLEDQLLGNVSRPLWVLLGAVAIVLLIACSNVANLFVVRAERRQRDLAVRQAIGAGRAQLIRSQMSEAILIAVCACIVAVFLAALTIPILLRAAPPEIPRLGDVAVNAATILFSLAATAVTAILCGFIPALRASSPDLTRLRDAGRTTRRKNWARDGLVVGQTAMALVLLIGCGLLIRSHRALSRVDPGYDIADIFTFQIAPEGDHLPDAPAYAQFHQNFMDRLALLPGVESVGIVENVPLNEGLSTTRFLTPESGSSEDAGALFDFTYAASDYFRTMGIQVLRGRAFTREDQTSQRGNVVIGKAVADQLWPGEDPIGRRLQREGLDTWETVIGVVDDVMQYGFRGEPQAIVYFPLVGQDPSQWTISSPAYVVKTARAGFIAQEIRELVREVAPEAPMYRTFTMAGLAADSMVQLAFTTLTLAIAALLALILGAVGLYGVLSYVVAERTQEIGVRMALGAQAQRVRRMVVVQGVRVVALGIIIGMLAAVAATRLLGGLLFNVQALDVSTFVLMAGVMMLVGTLASYIPARRASSVDPIESLRAT